MNNILITGVNGFVGSHLAEKLSTENNNVIGIVRDIIPSEWLNIALNKVTLVKGDIRNIRLLNRVISHYNIDSIYHIAAAAQVKSAWKNPIETFESNVIGTVNILESVRQLDDGENKIKVIILNTDKCYGERMDAVETDPYVESEPYATSKICQALIFKSYIKTYKMNKILKMVHCVNIFGYDPFNSRLITNVIKDFLLKKSPFIWNNDKSIREYVYIDDVINALIQVMTNDNLSKNIYHINTGNIYNQKDVILKINKYFPEIKCIYKDENVQYQIQNESLNSINWDWKPSHTFNEGIKKTIDLFIKYKNDWNI